MRYEYRNEESGETIVREFPMTGDIPQFVESEGKTYKKVFTVSTVHIPLSFQSSENQRNRPKYDKSPSGRKHFF